MTNQVNEVLDKIRDVCDLKRLEFGCEVYEPTCKKNSTFITFWSYPQDPNELEDGEQEMEGYELKCGSFDGEIDKKNIIGLTVQLNHLLWALWKADYVTFVSLTNEGAIDVMLGSGEDAETFHEVYYITKSVEDNLRSNPELTKWVHGVIIGNE